MTFLANAFFQAATTIASVIREYRKRHRQRRA
jgi:hypothetical protein